MLLPSVTCVTLPLHSAPWFRSGCNKPVGADVQPAPDDDDNENEDGDGGHQHPAAPTRVFDIPDAVISDIGSRLLAASLQLQLQEDIRSHAPCESLMQEAVANGSQRPRLRHLRQQLSIAGHLSLCDGLTQQHVIVEFGAGKAGLSRTLCRGHPSNTYVLVDRQSFKSKKDCRLRDEKEGAGAEQTYVRVRCDVQDLHLAAIDACCSAPVSIVGKHLCGGCTDLSMRANCHWPAGGDRPGFCALCDVSPAAAAPAAAAAPSSRSHAPPAAVVSQAAGDDVFVVATCCHHRMTWEAFAGQQHWLRLRFSPADFDVARRLSAWHNLWGAACAVQGGGGSAAAAGEAGCSKEERSFEWMRSVGRAAKDVFDACR